jgi:putative ABC transport system ATP-binding protein/lipoprotein-releasing system ATP-binding protein
MITLESVTKRYRLDRGVEIDAVRDATLNVRKGEFVVVTGRSGSGKTTLLNLAGGLTRPTAGHVLLDGMNLWQMPDRDQSFLRNQKIGFVFQFPSLMPSLTAVENVALPAIFGHEGSGQDALERAAELLEIVGLSDKLHALPRQLSAGQQQRVVIARSLINRTEILLADEPTSDLDEQTENEIMDLFQKIHGEKGITIVMVTHSSQLVRYGTGWIEMTRGRIAPQTAVGSFTN